MDEEALQTFRRQRLAEALKRLSDGNKSHFGRLLGYKSGAYVRQMLDGERPITEGTTRRIEQLRGMRGWFNQAAIAPAPSTTANAPAAAPYGWPFDAITLSQYSSLSPDQRGMVETFITMMLSLNASAAATEAQATASAPSAAR